MPFYKCSNTRSYTCIPKFCTVSLQRYDCLKSSNAASTWNVCVIVLLSCLLSSASAVNERNVSAPFEIWTILQRGLPDTVITLTAEEYEFTPLVWPKDKLNVKGDVVITALNASAPPLLSLGVLFNHISVHPGSNLRLENLVLDFDITIVQSPRFLGFFEILPGATAYMTNCTFLLMKCDADHASYFQSLLTAGSQGVLKPAVTSDMHLQVVKGTIGNAPFAFGEQGNWALDNFSVRCSNVFNYDLLKEAQDQTKVVAPLSGAEMVFNLLDRSTRYFDINNGISFQNSGWPDAGLLFERNITLRGPADAVGQARPVLFIRDKSRLWEIKGSTLALHNLILEFTAPAPINGESADVGRAFYVVQNSTTDLLGLVIPKAFATNYRGVYEVSNTRFWYQQCPQHAMSMALEAFVAYNASMPFTLNKDEGGRQLLSVPQASVMVMRTGVPIPFGRMELRDVEFECVRAAPHVAAPEPSAPGEDESNDSNSKREKSCSLSHGIESLVGFVVWLAWGAVFEL